MGGLLNEPKLDPHVSHNPKPGPEKSRSEHRSSIICAVVERPDQHCGDDFVIML